MSFIQYKKSMKPRGEPYIKVSSTRVVFSTGFIDQYALADFTSVLVFIDDEAMKVAFIFCDISGKGSYDILKKKYSYSTYAGGFVRKYKMITGDGYIGEPLSVDAVFALYPDDVDLDSARVAGFVIPFETKN